MLRDSRLHVAIDARAIGPHFPGISRATLGLLRGLHELDHAAEISVVHRYAQRELLEGSGITRDARFELVNVDVGPFVPRQQWQISRLARTMGPAVWHAPFYFRPFWGLPPTVVTIFDTIGPDNGRVIQGVRSRLARLSRRLLWKVGMWLSVRSAAHVITGSEAARRDLEHTYGLRLPPVTVIPLAADDDFCPPSAEYVARLRTVLGLPARYVVYVGSNKPHKNLESLVFAWNELVRIQGVGANMCLVIAGRQDPRYNGARVLGERLKLGASLRFVSDISDADLPALLGGAECFVFPSRYEGFGLPPLEAMACGTPVVSSNRSSLPEVVGDAGLLVEPDAAGLAGGIARVLDDPGLARDLRERGLRRAAMFSWQRTAAETMQLYHSVAD